MSSKAKPKQKKTPGPARPTKVKPSKGHNRQVAKKTTKKPAKKATHRVTPPKRTPPKPVKTKRVAKLAPKAAKLRGPKRPAVTAGKKTKPDIAKRPARRAIKVPKAKTAPKTVKGSAIKTTKPVKPAAKPVAVKGTANPSGKSAAIRVLKSVASTRTAKAATAYRGERRRRYEMLVDMRDQLLSQVRTISAASLTSSKQPGEELADVGSDNFSREMGLILLTEDGRKLVLIEEALERLEQGSYGTCIDCGCKISPRRLDAIPYAKLCVDCKGVREKTEERAPEPITSLSAEELTE